MKTNPHEMHCHQGRQREFRSEGTQLISSDSNAVKLSPNAWEKLSKKKVSERIGEVHPIPPGLVGPGQPNWYT